MRMYAVCVCGEGMWNVVYVEACMWRVRVCVSEWEVCGKDPLFLIQKSPGQIIAQPTGGALAVCTSLFQEEASPRGSGVSTADSLAPSCPSDSLHFLGLRN